MRCFSSLINDGIDHFGPLNVKVGRSNEKRLYCNLIGTVQKEVANKLETDSCLNAFIGFIARKKTIQV